MANVISPASLQEFRRNLAVQKNDLEPKIALGKTQVLYLSLGAQHLLGLDYNSDNNHVLITEDPEERTLYIRKSEKSEDTWEVKKYKDNGMRISKTLLCRFLRTYYKIKDNQSASFVLTKMEDGSAKVNIPVVSIVEGKEVSNG